MARYDTLLFDFDHTLFDSDASEAGAFAITMQACGVADPASLFAPYKAINRQMWAAVEAGKITPNDVRHQRFERLVAEHEIDADPHAMADDFAAGLGACGDMYDGAIDLLTQLATTHRLAMVTNAISAVQRTRIDRVAVAHHFEIIVISTEVDAAKPNPAIFDVTFDRLGHPPKATTLMIGDSLTSDIAGGTRYGLPTCWFNPHGKVAGSNDQITHEISALDQLFDLVA